MEIVEIYWKDLSESIREELLEVGLTDENIIDGVFPVTTLLIDGGTI